MAPALVSFRLSICGVAELEGFSASGVSDVLSILDPAQPVPEAFARFAPHRRTTLRFQDTIHAAPEGGAPEPDDVKAILDFGQSLGAAPGAHVLVHCFAGVSRSTAASAILMAQPNPGRETEAFQALLDLRPRAWPNSRMIGMADAMLGRRGRLVAALDGYFAAAVSRYGDLADRVRSTGGRDHEIPDGH